MPTCVGMTGRGQRALSATTIVPGRRPVTLLRVSAALFAAALLFLAPPAEASSRTVSLNLCTDQMLVLLAPERIAALSVLARDPSLSAVAAQARAWPTVRASAEAVLALRPDLVLATRFGAQTTLALLRQRGTNVVEMELPEDFPGISRVTRAMAATLGVPERGEALLTEMNATLAAVPPRAHPVTAIAWEPRGYTAAPGSTMDSVMRAAGLTNAADGRVLGIEALLHRKPDWLLLPDTPAFPSLATDMLAAPGLRGWTRRTLPPNLTLCATPLTARAVALLAR